MRQGIVHLLALDLRSGHLPGAFGCPSRTQGGRVSELGGEMSKQLTRTNADVQRGWGFLLRCGRCNSVTLCKCYECVYGGCLE